MDTSLFPDDDENETDFTAAPPPPPSPPPTFAPDDLSPTGTSFSFDPELDASLGSNSSRSWQFPDPPSWGTVSDGSDGSGTDAPDFSQSWNGATPAGPPLPPSLRASSGFKVKGEDIARNGLEYYTTLRGLNAPDDTNLGGDHSAPADGGASSTENIANGTLSTPGAVSPMTSGSSWLFDGSSSTTAPAASSVAAPRIPGLETSPSATAAPPSSNPGIPGLDEIFNPSSVPLPKIPGLDEPPAGKAQALSLSSPELEERQAPSAPPAPGATRPFAPGDAPFRAEADGTVSFDPQRLSAGVQAAFQAGAIDPATYTQLLPKAQAAEQALAAERQLMETNPVAARLKAVGVGFGRGSAFLLGAVPGAEGGAALGTLAGPFVEIASPVLGALGGAVTGGMAAWGYDQVLAKLGQYSATVKSFADAAQAHPNYDAAGNMISMVAGLPKAATELAARGVSALAGEGEGAAAQGLRAVARGYQAGAPGLASSVNQIAQDAATRSAGGASAASIAQALAARAGGYAASNALVDSALRETGKILGLSDEGPTWSSAGQAAILGALMMGHGLQVEGVAPEQVAQAVVNRRLNLPLTSREEEILTAFDGEVNRQVAAGKLSPTMTAEEAADLLRRTTGRQMTDRGQPYGVTAIDIAPEGNVSEPAPAAPAPRDHIPPALPAPAGTRETAPPAPSTAVDLPQRIPGLEPAPAPSDPAARASSVPSTGSGPSAPPSAPDAPPLPSRIPSFEDLAPPPHSAPFSTDASALSVIDAAGAEDWNDGEPYVDNYENSLRNNAAKTEQKSAPWYAQAGIKTTNDPQKPFSVESNHDGTITPNLSRERLLKIVKGKTQGNLDAAREYINDAHREEIFHTAWRATLRKQWLAVGGPASGIGFVRYGDQRIDNIANDVIARVEKLPPREKEQAIHDAAGLLQLYKKRDLSDADIWESIKVDADVRHDFVVEAIRELAHFSVEARNTETGYMKYLHPIKYSARMNFFQRILSEVQEGEFGPRLRDEINATKTAVLHPETIRIPQAALPPKR